MQTCVDLHNRCNLMATVLSWHCCRTVARYVTECNTVTDYCLNATSHSARSAAEQTADRSTLKYTKVTEQQTHFGYGGIFHRYLLVTNFHGK